MASLLQKESEAQLHLFVANTKWLKSGDVMSR